MIPAAPSGSPRGVRSGHAPGLEVVVLEGDGHAAWSCSPSRTRRPSSRRSDGPRRRLKKLRPTKTPGSCPNSASRPPSSKVKIPSRSQANSSTGPARAMPLTRASEARSASSAARRAERCSCSARAQAFVRRGKADLIGDVLKQRPLRGVGTPRGGGPGEEQGTEGLGACADRDQADSDTGPAASSIPRASGSPHSPSWLPGGLGRLDRGAGRRAPDPSRPRTR